MSWDILPKNRIQYIFEKLKTVIPVVKANPSDTATDNLTKLDIDGTNYNVTDADYRSNMHTFTTTDYNSTTHKFEGGETSMSYAVKSIFSPLTNVFNALKTAINDHASVFTTITNAISSINTALDSKVDKVKVYFNELSASGRRFGNNLVIYENFTAGNDTSHENNNLAAIKTVVNNLADYTEDNVQVESLSDTTPYLYRKSPAIGTRVMENALVGCSFVVNQLAYNGDFQSASGWSGLRCTPSASNGELTGTCNSAGNIAVFMTSAFHFQEAQNHKVLVMFDMKASVVSERTGRVALSDSTLNDNYVEFAISSVNTYKSFAGILYPTASGAKNIRIALMGNNAIGDTMTIRKLRIVDLTVEFGSDAIPNNAYTKEQSTAGTGIAWLKSQGHDFSEYIDYNTGTLESVDPSAKKVVGFNQWDEEFELGTVSTSNGSLVNSTTTIRSKNKIYVLPKEKYCLRRTISSTSNNDYYVLFYDSENNCLQYVKQETGDAGVLNKAAIILETDSYKIFETPENTAYIRLRMDAQTTYNHDICINISKPTGTPKNGDYLPYESETHSISQSPLRGVPTLVNDAIVYDGDVRKSDGSTDRKYSRVDLGSLTWEYKSSSARFVVQTSLGIAYPSSTSDLAKMICAKYRNAAWTDLSDNTIDKIITTRSDGISIRDLSAGTDPTVFKNSLSGVYLIYELATPTTESLPPYTNPQKSFVGGTEEWLTDNDIPVGHQSEYKKLPDIYSDDYMEYQFNNHDMTDIQSYYESKPYLYRRSIAIGDRVYDKKLIGASVVANQLVQNGNFADTTNWNVGLMSISVANNIATLTASNTNTSANINQSLSIANGHKCLVVFDIKPSVTGNIKYDFYNGSSFTGETTFSATANVWNSHKKIVSIGLDVIQFYIRPNQTGTSGSTYQLMNVNIIDLTLMFGSSIADAAYTKETAQAGSGIQWLKDNGFDFNKYIPYNTGELCSVNPSGKKVVGKNMYVGSPYKDDYINGNSWETASETLNGYPVYYRSDAWNGLYRESYLLAGDYIFSCYIKSTDSQTIYLYFSGRVISPETSYTRATSTSWTRITYRFTLAEDGYFSARIEKNNNNGTVYISQYQIDKGSTATTFEPYTAKTYPISSSPLHGIAELVDDKIVYNGDERSANGDTLRKYGIVDLGTLNWYYNSTYNQYSSSGISTLIKLPANDDTVMSDMICSSVSNITTANQVYGGTIGIGIATNGAIYYKNENSSASVSPTGYLVYELATPTTEQLTPYTECQICYPDGTEEFVDNRDFPVPVGHESEYIKVPDWMMEEHVKDFRDRMDNAIAYIMTSLVE